MIEGTVTGQDAAVVRISSISDKVRASLRDSMQRWWYRLQAQVVTSKLSGDPLHRRTAVLVSSINVGGAQTATEFTETDTEMIGRVGTKVRYGAIHENGGTFAVPEHLRTITQVFGHPVTPRIVAVRAHSVTFPMRSFLRSTIRDMSTQIREGIKADIAKAVKAV